MKVAVETRFHGATNNKVARISAKAVGYPRKEYPYDYSLSHSHAHEEAAARYLYSQVSPLESFWECEFFGYLPYERDPGCVSVWVLKGRK